MEYIRIPYIINYFPEKGNQKGGIGAMGRIFAFCGLFILFFMQQLVKSRFFCYDIKRDTLL